MAHRGTLFLDEISEMDKYGQSRLLRVLQERQIMRLGGDKYVPVDVRVIAASNQNLMSLIVKRIQRQRAPAKIRGRRPLSQSAMDKPAHHPGLDIDGRHLAYLRVQCIRFRQLVGIEQLIGLGFL